MTKKKGGAQRINSTLTSALNKLVAEVMKDEDPPKEGETPKAPKYSLTDKMKVLDRMLKHEAIRLKVQENVEGDFFRNRGKGAENGDE